MAKTANNSIIVAGASGADVPSEDASESSSRQSSPASTIDQRMEAVQEPDDASDQAGDATADAADVAVTATPSPAAHAPAEANGSDSIRTAGYMYESSAVVIPPARTGYENSNLDDITLRQLGEDISAYTYDLSFCRAQLEEPNLTPQEARTLQLRTLDLGHQIRHSQHRIERLRVEMRGRPLRATYGGSGAATSSSLALRSSNQSAANGAATSNGKHTAAAAKRSSSALPNGNTGTKRSSLAGGEDDASTTTSAKRLKTQQASTPKHSSPGLLPDDSALSFASGGGGGGGDDGSGGGDNMALQRLGYWKCRLCEAPKYLLAGTGRSPAMPCKWPLKDISKMITHFTEMHSEHSPPERCSELGSALSRNRGPFEYWLRRTRAQNVGDGSVIDECIGALVGGKMPGLLRRLSRAAAGMPTGD